MLPPIPYLDVAGYRRRSKVVPQDIDLCVSLYPGYLEHRIAAASSRFNARLQKRYRVPLGQEAPTLVAQGTTPPGVVLGGRPNIGSLEIAIQVTGYSAPAVNFTWSLDGGLTTTAGSVSAPGNFALARTGIVASFGPGPYATDNVYTASTPVPEIVLGWLVAVLDVDLWHKRGVNPQDPSIAEGIAERDRVLEELAEAANSETALFDLPTNDVQGDSAIAHAGPLFYTEASPFVGADLQERAGRAEDSRGCGDFGSTDS